MKKISTLIAASVAMLFCIQTVIAQNSKSEKKAAKEAAVKKMVEAHNYVFKANFANPQGGGRKTLTSDYDLVVSKDTLVAYLPYFGRAYTAPLSSTDGGIEFTSTKFEYTTTLSKNGSWDILIKPKDSNRNDWRDVQSLRLNITTSGYASLSVTSTNRSYISFDGYIEERKKK